MEAKTISTGVEKENKTPNASICWNCRHAIPSVSTGCNWSKNFIPINGWDVIQNENEDIESYKVKRCPCFEEDTAESRRVYQIKNDNAAVRLAEIILKSQVTHYKDLLRNYAKAFDNRVKFVGEIRSIERDFLSEYYANLTLRKVDMVSFCNQCRREAGIGPIDERMYLIKIKN